MGRRQALLKAGRSAALLCAGLWAALALALAPPPAAASGAAPCARPASSDLGCSVSWQAPATYIEGETFEVSIELRSTSSEVEAVPVWLLGAGAFDVEHLALGERDPKSASLPLEAGARLSVQFDLGPRLGALDSLAQRFSLNIAEEAPDQAREIRVLHAAEKGIDFMTLAPEQLAGYQVVLRTSRGSMRLAMWPDVAPNHVRNFLDLAYTGFYDGTKFHRVVPSMMIQGGRAREGTSAPRKVQAEFNLKRHEPGVLSMARLGTDINSADSEFFIMHATYPSLDGKYTAFGKLEDGFEVVDRIVHSGDTRFRANDPRAETPTIDQVIEKAIVVKAPRKTDQNK